MKCYNCGCALSEKDFCTGCGADVVQYKKVMYLSNQYYNEGLEKAQVRDLSGAVACLKQSLKLNKNHTNARNLLGLVYFEMGEAVAALTEWVISKSYQSEKNIADDYITKVQSNPSGLEDMNVSVKKYNQALSYCQQDSLDMATIQLRKVVLTNPKLIPARQLLALLYIRSEEWTKAKKELDACKRIDNGNVLTNRYLKEVDSMLGFEESKNAGKRKTQETAIWSKSGNDIVIQPNNPRDAGAWNVFLNILIGLVIGLAIGWFLLAPIRVNSERAGMDDELTSLREQLNVKTTAVDELTQQISLLTTDKEVLENKLEDYESSTGLIAAHTSLMQAQIEYNKGSAADKMKIAEYLDQVDLDFIENVASEEYITLYEGLKQAVGSSVATSFYDSGYEAYRNQDYETAIERLNKAVDYDPNNAEALYALANAYRENKDYVQARKIYVQVIELFPETEKAIKAQGYIAEIDAMGS
ncbi:MAG: tetratricopeptide repeat protein [Lachnospiraceae bacterium]|nr:tetratricopeptide repeat protein [Lachnospiraceae bacterium]